MSEFFTKPGPHPLYESIRDPVAKLPLIDGYRSATPVMRQRKLNEYLGLRSRMVTAWQTFLEN